MALELKVSDLSTPALNEALIERKRMADDIIKSVAGKDAGTGNPLTNLSDEDRARIKALHGDAQILQGEINKRAEMDGIVSDFDKIGKAATRVAGMPGFGPVGGDDVEPGFGPMTPGQAFVSSKAYRDQQAAGAFKVDAKKAIQSGLYKDIGVSLDYNSAFPVYRKAMSIMAKHYPEAFLRKGTAINSGASSGGGFILPEFDLIPEQLARASLDVMGLLRLQPTSTNLIEWLRQDARITGAATVPEYTDTADVVTGKPEGGATWSLQTMAVKTIAVHVAVVNQQLDDAPEIRGVIDEDLRFEVEEELNSQILSGSGTGNDMTGILTALTAASISAITYDPTGTPTHDNILDALLDAWVTIRLANEPMPTGTLIHWRDWQRARTAKASGTGDYIIGSPSEGKGPMMLWDVPLVGTSNITEGSALVGNYQMARLHMREETGVRLGYANNDFLANRVRLLAELRACVTVRRPGAFRKVTGLNS
jgi:HK97 family phage major capsid protein